jgi:hypothetical protein
MPDYAGNVEQFQQYNMALEALTKSVCTLNLRSNSFNYSQDEVLPTVCES